MTDAEEAMLRLLGARNENRGLSREACDVSGCMYVGTWLVHMHPKRFSERLFCDEHAKLWLCERGARELHKMKHL